MGKLLPYGIVGLTAMACLTSCAVTQNIPNLADELNGNWVHIEGADLSSDRISTQDFYDADSFHRDGKTASYRTKLVMTSNGTTFTYLSHEITDCDTQQSETISTLVRTSDDGSLRELPAKMPVYKSYRPGTPGATTIHFVCSRQN
jgi:hypothetical protein